MSNLDLLKNLSDAQTNRAFELHINQNNSMSIYMLLFGKGPFRIEAFPGAGHNNYVVLESIYNFAKKNKNIDVVQVFEYGLMTSIRFLHTPEEFMLIMGYIIHQLENQKNRKAPFEMNVAKLLSALKERILSYDKIKSNEVFMEQIRQSEQYLEKNYNYKIL